MTPKVLSQRSERSIDVIGDAIGGGTRVVGIEVLVNVEDEVGVTAVGVLNPRKSVCTSIGDELLGAGPVVPGKQADLVGTCIADRCDGCLDGVGPHVDIWDVVRLVPGLLR